MPTIIIINPMIFFWVITVLKNNLSKIVINKYPLDSRIGAIESGTTLKAYTVINVQKKNREYDNKTKGFRYSCIILG